MSDRADFLTLQQWLSPAFPLGGFAYSHGLETLIAQGSVRSADDLKDWLRTLIRHGSIQSDAVLLVRGFNADAEQAIRVDREARAFATTQERLRETALQGKAFAETCNAIWGLDLPAFVLPVAVGQAARHRNIALDTVLPLYLQSIVSNLVTVAVRLVPLGQTEGQKVLAELAQDLLEIPAEDGPLYSNTFLWDIAAMHHETLQPKLFRS